MASPTSQSELNSLYKRCLEQHRAGKLANAEKLYLKLLKIVPDEPEVIQSFAMLRFHQGKHARAIELLERARVLAPQSADIEYNIGKILMETGRTAEAEPHFRACLKISPDFADAMANLGAALSALGRYAEAISTLKRAAELLPSSIGPLVNLASILLFLHRYDSAETVLTQALRIDPDDIGQRLRLAQTQYRNEKFADAVASFQKVLDARPDHLSAQGGLLRAKLRLCDWKDLEVHRWSFVNSFSAADGKSPATTPSPHTALLICDDPADCLASARIHAASLGARQPLHTNTRAKGGRDKIRVAYLSADYREHATSFLISELIESHDRSTFEVTGLSFGPNIASPMRQRMEEAFDRFEDVTELSARNIAARMAALSIDIAVDLHGFTRHNRREIFSYRAAPVQVQYLGWPGTTGATFYDYVLADPVVVPQENFKYFSEQVVWLPHCYQPNDSQRNVAPERPSRTDCELPETGFLFCCFNNTFKILPEIFDIWMRLLRQAPGSVFWLMEGDEIGRENLLREASARGVDERRLVFAPHLPNDQHIARLGNADLFLDTLPYNAHTTASDALWQGVPIVTCTGRTFASRVATSLLHNVGLPEMAVTSLADYEALALSLARDPAAAQALKEQLLGGRSTAPLFDAKRLARDVEKAYREMVRRADAGEAPQFIDVRTL